MALGKAKEFTIEPDGNEAKIDYNSPEFKRALELARKEVLEKKSEELPEDNSVSLKPGSEQTVQDFRSDSEFKKSVSLDSSDMVEVRKKILGRALEILQGNIQLSRDSKGEHTPYDVVNDLMKLQESLQEKK